MYKYKYVLVILLVFLLQKAVCQTPELRVAINGDSISINDKLFINSMSLSNLKKILGDEFKMIRSKKKLFRDEHHGKWHVIPASIQVIYDDLGMVFSGRNAANLNALRIHFLSKEENNELNLEFLDKNYKAEKANSGINITRNQYFELYSDKDLHNIGPLTNNSFSGELKINGESLNPNALLVDIDKEEYKNKAKLSDDSFHRYEFSQKLFSQNFSCSIPAPPFYKIGFCACLTPRIQLLLNEDNMKPHSLKFRISIQ